MNSKLWAYRIEISGMPYFLRIFIKIWKMTSDCSNIVLIATLLIECCFYRM